MHDKYEEAQDLSEIETIFNKSHASESLAWQNKDKGRVVYDITEIGFNNIDQTCKVSLKPSSNAISGLKPVYIKLSHRQSIFRITEYKLDGQIIRFNTPGQVKALNTQNFPRKEFNITKKKVEVEIFCTHKDWDQDKNFMGTIMNISRQGLCVLVPDGNRYLIENASRCYLKKLFQTELKNDLELETSYILKFRYRSEGILNVVNRVGFQFEKIVNQEILDQI